MKSQKNGKRNDGEIQMSMLYVECPLCKHSSNLVGYLQEEDLKGTSLEGLSLFDAELRNLEHLQQFGKPIVLDAWERFDATLDDNGTNICPNCNRRAVMITV